MAISDSQGQIEMDEDEIVDAGAELDWDNKEVEVSKGATPDHLVRERSLTLLFSQSIPRRMNLVGILRFQGYIS